MLDEAASPLLCDFGKAMKIGYDNNASDMTTSIEGT